MKNFFTILLWALVVPIYSQITIIPLNTDLLTVTMDNIWDIQLVSLDNTPVSCQLLAVVKDKQGNTIVESSINYVTIKSGYNSFASGALPYSPVTNYSTHESAKYIQQTGRFPLGEYVFCYFCKNLQGILVSEFCYEKGMVPMLPPELMQPGNGEVIETTSPLLTWIPPFPVTGNQVRYDLQLVEMKDKQSPGEALEMNTPLIARSVFAQNVLLYPVDAPSLTVGHSYAWRVSANISDYNLGTTDTWSFKVKRPENIEKHDSYRLLTEKPDGNNYVVTNGRLKFSYKNKLSADTLNYTITPLDERKNAVSNLPTIQLKKGLNKIDIDVNSLDLEKSKKYIMEVNQPNNDKLYLEFYF